jgi:hypothetical protein
MLILKYGQTGHFQDQMAINSEIYLYLDLALLVIVKQVRSEFVKIDIALKMSNASEVANLINEFFNNRFHINSQPLL